MELVIAVQIKKKKPPQQINPNNLLKHVSIYNSEYFTQ